MCIRDSRLGGSSTNFSSASLTLMITTYSPPIFLTARLRSTVVPSSYVFIMTVDVEMLLVEYRMIATTEGLLLIYHDVSLKLVYDVCCISAIGACDRTDESASLRTKGGRSEQAVVFFRQCPWLAGPFPLSLLQWFISTWLWWSQHYITSWGQGHLSG